MKPVDRLPSRLGDDHLGAEVVEFVPQLLGLQAARDLRHLLARDAGIGGDERLRAHGGRAPAEVPVPVQGGQVSQRLLVAGGLFHKLFFFCFVMDARKQRNKQEHEGGFHFIFRSAALCHTGIQRAYKTLCGPIYFNIPLYCHRYYLLYIHTVPSKSLG